MNLEKLKSVIQEAVPEIMELRIGCVMKIIPGSHYASLVEKHWGTEWTYYYNFFTNGRSNISLIEYYKNKDKYKILGRPIRLADVLVAIYKMRTSKESVFVRQDGVIFRWEKFTEGGDGHHGVTSTYIEWNLLDDNLDHQSPDCIKFLTNLLCKNT